MSIRDRQEGCRIAVDGKIALAIDLRRQLRIEHPQAKGKTTSVLVAYATHEIPAVSQFVASEGEHGKARYSVF